MIKNWRKQERKNMVILIDTNVILDFLMVREEYYKNARDILSLCADGKIKGYIAFHTLPNAFFIMRKTYSLQQRREILNRLCDYVTVTSVSHDQVRHAILRNDFKDFEDCLQAECAKAINANYIITRNILDFSQSDTKAVTPIEFLQNIFDENDL